MVKFDFITTRTLAFITCWFLCLFTNAQKNIVHINIDLSKEYQTIQNFGASDAWSCQFVGNWPEKKKNEIADLLFSLKNHKDGSAKGIGLSLWRFNLGAGSAQMGDQSGITDEWRRGESFLTKDGQYDWDKQVAQRWFLKAARKRGVEKFLAFTNSPPIPFTINSRAYANAGKVNISPLRYIDFAIYLTKVIKGIAKASHVKFDYISPFNEPEWDWSDGGQEGCPYTNREIADITRVISKEFEKEGINTKILITESGSISYLYSTGDKPGKGNKIKDFFHTGSENYIGDLYGVRPTISAHSYFTTSPMSAAIKDRKELADAIASVKGLNYWQSEYCILGDNQGEINGNRRDLGINAALYLASVIHTDLTVANASAWQWWTAISPYNYKDGLIYIDKDKKDGHFYTSKMLWALGNYSRFIRPGAIRVEALSDEKSGEIEKGSEMYAISNSDRQKPLLVSAYKKGKDFTAVLVNQNDKELTTDLSFHNAVVNLRYAFVTSEDMQLNAINIKRNGTKNIIPAHSIVTLTGRIKNN